MAAPASIRRGGRRRWIRTWPLWVLLAPALLLATVFKFIPMGQGLWFSVLKVQPYLGNKFVGGDNYAYVWGAETFRSALVHTVLLAIMQTAGAVVVGFVMALLLEGSGWGLWLTRTVVVLPVVTAMAVIGEIWRIIYFPAPNGFLNSILGSFGLPAGAFLDSPSTALVSIGAVGIWAGAPYNMVVFLAGLAGIDRNLYEAAAVDGASTLRRIWSITIPGLAGSFIIVLTLAAIRALGIFTEVYVLTGGGPAGSTTVWMTAVFSLGFERNNIGVASAASVLLLLTTMGLTILTQFLTRRKTDR